MNNAVESMPDGEISTGIIATLSGLILSLRPKQWTKNLLVFAPLIFSGELLRSDLALKSLAAYGLLCALSGAAYVFNDIKDLEKDRHHDKKRNRPIATGQVSPIAAGVFGALLASIALGASVALGTAFASTAAAFFALQLAYTFWLKYEVIIDVMTIAASFVLRAVAGAAVISVPTSPWLLACAALLALFLGLAKRRHELVLLDDDAQNHRSVLAEYSAGLVDEMISTVTSATIVAYALYTFFSSTAKHSQYLMLTTPFVIYGLFRYLYLMHRKNLGGSPEDILLTDKPLIIDIGLWLAAVGAAIYYSRGVGA